MSNLKRKMPASRHIFILFVLFTLGNMATGNAVAQSVGCDDNFVKFGAKLSIKVDPTGGDDAVNIECALNNAVGLGIQRVLLGQGTYRISYIIATNFVGVFQGVSATKTTVRVIGGSIDCEGFTAAGMIPAAIKFVGGSPTIKLLTLAFDSQAPCSSGASLSRAIQFTGSPTFTSDCDFDVIFALADRMDIVGNSNSVNVGIAAEAEGLILGGCKVSLLGTLKLNRVAASGVSIGAATSMRGRAQVDIRFSEFVGGTTGIFVLDSKQFTSINNNSFVGQATGNNGYSGIAIGTINPDAPETTRVAIENNTFDVTSSFSSPAIGVNAVQLGRIADMDIIVTGNRFALHDQGQLAEGIGILDASNGLISANRFSGNGEGVFIDAIGSQPASGWTVVSNLGFADLVNSFKDVFLGSNTQLCIVGAGQSAQITDLGVNNTILGVASAKASSESSGDGSQIDRQRRIVDHVALISSASLLAGKSPR